MIGRTLTFATILGALASTAHAEESLLERWGMGLCLGGGVAGFTDEVMRDASTTAGVWDLRALVGLRRSIALEAAYQGSAQGINAIGLDDSAILVGTTLEADVRFNVLAETAVQPYVFLGTAWRRYDLTNADTNTSSVASEDNLLELPMGVGVSYREAGLIWDLRAELRTATDADLVPAAGDDVKLHTWGVTARIGHEL